MNDETPRKKVYAEIDPRSDDGKGIFDHFDEMKVANINYYIWTEPSGNGFSVRDRREVLKDLGKSSEYFLGTVATFLRKEDAHIFATTLYCGDRYREMKAIENELNELFCFEEWAMGGTE